MHESCALSLFIEAQSDARGAAAASCPCCNDSVPLFPSLKRLPRRKREGEKENAAVTAAAERGAQREAAAAEILTRSQGSGDSVAPGFVVSGSVFGGISGSAVGGLPGSSGGQTSGEEGNATVVDAAAPAAAAARGRPPMSIRFNARQDEQARGSRQLSKIKLRRRSYQHHRPHDNEVNLDFQVQSRRIGVDNDGSSSSSNSSALHSGSKMSRSFHSQSNRQSRSPSPTISPAESSSTTGPSIRRSDSAPSSLTSARLLADDLRSTVNARMENSLSRASRHTAARIKLHKSPVTSLTQGLARSARMTNEVQGGDLTSGLTLTPLTTAGASPQVPRGGFGTIESRHSFGRARRGFLPPQAKAREQQQHNHVVVNLSSLIVQSGLSRGADITADE